MGRKKKQVIFEPKMDISKLERKSVMRLTTLVQNSTEWEHGPLLNGLRKQVLQSVKENGLLLILIFWMNIWKKKYQKAKKEETTCQRLEKRLIRKNGEVDGWSSKKICTL